MEDAQTLARIHRLDLNMNWKPGHVAAYLVETDEALVLVDAGVTGDGEDGHEKELRAEVRGMGHELTDIDALLITHPHLDHVGQAPAVIKEADPTVVAYETVPEALKEVDEDRIRRCINEVGIQGTAADEAFERWKSGLEGNRKALPPEAIDKTVSDGEVFKVNNAEFEAVYTPGHQADHVSYVLAVGDDRAVLAGDSLSSSFRSVIYHAGFDGRMWEAVDAYYDGLSGIEDISPDLAYPGHGPVFEDVSGAIKGARESLGALVEDVYETVLELQEPSAIDVALKRKKKGHDVNYIVFDNVGALGYLEQKGRIESYLDDGVRRFAAE